MKFAPGQVVNLKSGGQPLTVVAVDGDSIECMWLGEEGDLFRESLPAIALELAFGDEAKNLASADAREFANADALASDDDDEEDEDEENDEDEEDEDEDDEGEEEDDEDEEDDEEDDDEEDEAEEDRALEEVREQPAPAAPRRRRVPA